MIRQNPANLRAFYYLVTSNITFSSHTKTNFMRIVYIALLPVFILMSSCRYFGGEWVSGNGKIVNRQKDVGTFSNVEVHGSVDVQVRQDSANLVRIETDENIFEYLDVYKDGNTLVIRPMEGYNLHPKKLVAYISAPVFRKIAVSGDCDITSEGQISGQEELELKVSGSGDIAMQVSLPKVHSEISGSGSLLLKGQATNFEVRVSGSGDVNCFDLVTENTDLQISGSADAEINASKQLNIKVSGSGNVEYKGNAAVSQNISGAGSVKKVS